MATFDELLSRGAKQPQQGGSTFDSLLNKGTVGGDVNRNQKFAAAANIPNDLNFFERLDERREERTDMTQKILERQKAGEQTLGETVLQVGGQVGGSVADFIGEGLSGLGKFLLKAVPDEAEKRIGEVLAGKRQGVFAKDLLPEDEQFVGVNEGFKQIAEFIKLPQAAQKYEEFSKENPRAAANIESIVNIGALIPIGKGATIAGKGAVQTTRAASKVAGKGATVLEAKLKKQIFEETLDIVKPRLTTLEKGLGLEAGRGTVSQKILPRQFEKISLTATAKEKEMARAVVGVINKSKNPIDNISALRNKIVDVAKLTDEGLKNNNAIFNKSQLKSALNIAKEKSRVVFGSDKTLQNSYDAVVDEMIRQVDKIPKKNISGLLQARKNFDNIINDKFPKLLQNPVGDSAKKNAVMDVRRAVNQFIEDKLPAKNSFKAQLRQQNLMYDAIKNISKKTASSVDASVVQKAMSALRQNPLVSGVTGGILTFGALTGLLANPVIIGGLALGGSITLGTKIVTSKTLKTALIKVLRFLEKAGKTADAKSIKAVVGLLDNE